METQKNPEIELNPALAPAIGASQIGCLKDLAARLRTLTPLIEEAGTLIENSFERLPQAKEQMQSVSRATEEATMFILNEAEQITTFSSQADTVLSSLRTSLSGVTGSGANGDSINGCIADLENLIKTIRSSSLSISMALQVQDITSQQLAGAGYIVDKVGEDLRKVMNSNGHAEPTQESSLPQSFDASARFESREQSQNMIDELFQQMSTQR